MTTKLVVMRHGKPNSDGYAEDALRPLSDEGRQAQRKVAEALKGLGIRPDLILTSPLLRAVQSAEVVSEILGGAVQEEFALGPDFDEDVIFNHLSSPEHNETYVVVGHAPTLAGLVEKFVGPNALPGGICKSGAVLLEFDDRIGWMEAVLIAYVRPS